MDVGIRYRLAAGVDVVPVGSDAVCLRSDTLVVRLEGASAMRFAEQIVPLLDGRRSVTEIARAVPGVDPHDLERHLAALARNGVLVPHDPASESEDTSRVGWSDLGSPFSSMLHALGVPLRQAHDRLRQLHVVIFGLEAQGVYVAETLARAGVGRLTLVDPFRADPADRAPWPMIGPAAAPCDVSRQEALRGVLRAAYRDVTVDCWPEATLEQEHVRSLAATAGFLIGCFDQGFRAAHEWINRASLEFRVPALFGELRGTRVFAGPLVLPYEGPCFLCARMRETACAEDFREAMAYEEFLDRQRAPRRAPRPSLPPSAMHLGAIIAMEVLRTTLALGRPALVGRVEELDLLGGDRTTHTILQRPDCPACRKKPAPPGDPASSAPRGGASAPGLAESVTALVSARFGVIRKFEPITKDPSEPLLPHIVRAELANHRFRENREDAFVSCSGKGFTEADARLSALGEAAERYSASMWGMDRVLHARRGELEGPSLDPRRLVLYRETQYPALPYAPYSDASAIGWVQAQSLSSGDAVHVPAIGVYMAYDPRSRDELLLPPTSSGLAAGPTLAAAVLSAAFEVLERDAFVCTWLNRLPAERIEPLGHPDVRVAGLVRAYERRGVHIELYRLPTDHPCHVFLGMGVAEPECDGPAVVVGLGAHLDPELAARSALLEVGQVRPALRIRLRDPSVARRRDELVEAPERVSTLEDHDLLYADPRMVPSFEFLRGRPIVPFEWQQPVPQQVEKQLSVLVEALRPLGTELLYCDLTTDDLAARGAQTARVIVPDFQPIYFGEQERRLGGRRLYELPRRLGVRDACADPADLNSDPHPLA